MATDNAGAAASSAKGNSASKANTAAIEPSDADLMKILSGAAEAAGAAVAGTDDNDDDPEHDGEEEHDDAGAGADGGEGEGGEGEEGDKGEAGAEAAAKPEGEEDDDAGETGDDDPDAKLDDEDQKVRAKFTPEQQERFDKAVQKKTRRILELKTELAEEQQERERLASELEEARKGATTASAPTADNPLADVEDESKLDEKLGEARTLRRFALANPDGAFVDEKTGKVVQVEDPESPPQGVVKFSKQRIGQILADTEELLQEHGPKRREFLKQRAAAEAEAVREIPWLKNKSSQGYHAVEATLRHEPRLRGIAGIKLLLADAFIGRHVRLGAKAQAAAKNRAAGNGGGNGSRKAPPSPGGSSRPARERAGAAIAGEAVKEFTKTGRDPDDRALRAILRS